MELLLQTIKPATFGLSVKKSAAEFFGGFFRHLRDHFVPSHTNDYKPLLLGHRSLGLLACLLVAVKVFTLAALAMGPVAQAQSPSITPATIITLTNRSRAERHLPALTENLLLTKAAEAKARDMLAKGYFSHNTPDGRTPWDFINGTGYNYLTAGENLAVNFTEAESVEQAWMNSPSHKANIVNENYEEIGVGIARGVYQNHEAVFVVQMFGTPIDQKVVITNTPTKVGSLPESGQVQMAPPAGLISEAVAEVTGGMVKVAVKTLDSATKVLARFESHAVMLDAKPNGSWEGYIPLSSLASAASPLTVRAYDIGGGVASYGLGEFAPTAEAAFLDPGVPQVAGASTQMFGVSFNPKNFEYQFYLIFIGALLLSLVLAIGLKRHIQHMSVIANSSFVIILASLLYLAG